MKKTKKAALAVFACTLAIAGSGLILAACNGNDGDAENNSHTHAWSNWIVEDANLPTAQHGGKATRYCSGEGECDAEISEKEYALPTLNDNSYIVSDDTAKVGVDGTGKYMYLKDGVMVEFTAATPAKQHVHEDGAWTVSEENKPTADKTGKSTRTCTADDDFCDWTAEDLEYELPALNENDYTITVTRQATCSSTGKVSYTFNKDEVNVTFDYEIPVAPQAHTLTKQEGSEADCELQVPGRMDYYSCECGKYFKDADGLEEFENLADIVIPPSHDVVEVEANAISKNVILPDDTTSILFKCMAHYVCNACGKTFKDEDGTNEVTSVYCFSRRGLLAELGNNAIDATGVTNAIMNGLYGITYVAESSAVHTITFDEGANIGAINYVLTGTSAIVSTYTPNGWNASSAAYSKFAASDTAGALSNSVTVNMVKGEWITIFVSASKFNVNVETQPILVFGDNRINITEAYAMFIDEYEFVPTETKKYSMTVPAGVEVLMNNEDFIIGDDRTVNFEGTANTKIVFAFRNSKTGPLTVTIGGCVDLPKITPDEPLSAFELVGHAASVLEVGDIEEGTYTLTIIVPNSLMRTFMYFGKNISENYSDYFADNGNTVAGNPAEVSFQFPMANVLNGAPYQASIKTTTWTVTLDLKKGDKLVFINSGMTGATQISLTKI